MKHHVLYAYALCIFASVAILSQPTASAQRGRPMNRPQNNHSLNHRLQLSPGPVIHFSPASIPIGSRPTPFPPHQQPRYRPINPPPSFRPGFNSPFGINNNPFFNNPYYNPYYWHPYHPFYGWNSGWQPIGSFIAGLAATAIIVGTINAIDNNRESSTKVYYDNGNFYIKEGGQFRVINAPIGMQVPEIPSSAIRCIVGTTVYYYYAGIFYRYEVGGYTVVNAPVGAIVYNLPPGANRTVINGNTYYLLDGAYYMPTYYDGEPAFQVADLQ